LTDLQVRPNRGFLCAMAQTTRPHARVKRFRKPKFEVDIQSLKNPPKVQNWAQNELEIFGQKSSCIKIAPINGP